MTIHNCETCTHRDVCPPEVQAKHKNGVTAAKIQQTSADVARLAGAIIAVTKDDVDNGRLGTVFVVLQALSYVASTMLQRGGATEDDIEALIGVAGSTADAILDSWDARDRAEAKGGRLD